MVTPTSRSLYLPTGSSVVFQEVLWCNDPTIGSYNHYHLSPNGIPSCNQKWYGLVYLVYKRLVNLGQGAGNNGVALGTLLGRIALQE